MDDLRTAAAAFFQGKGKNVVTEKEFTMDISMKLRWMQPSEAERLLPLFLSEGVLKKDGEYLRPAFDVNGIDVPFGYRPPAGLLMRTAAAPRTDATRPADLLGELFAAAERGGMKKKDIMVAANAVQKKINVDIEIAVLLMLKENGIDISDHIGKAYATISER
jgi:hypothetical protein